MRQFPFNSDVTQSDACPSHNVSAVVGSCQRTPLLLWEDGKAKTRCSAIKEEEEKEEVVFAFSSPEQC